MMKYKYKHKYNYLLTKKITTKMKKNVIICLLCLLAISSCTTKQEPVFNLQGKIGDLGDPAKIFLNYALDGTQHLDSAVLENGNFSFKDSLDSPVRAQLILYYSEERNPRRAERFNLYLEPGIIKLQSPDSLKNIKFVKSPINKEYEKYIESVGKSEDISAQVNKKYTEATPEQQADPEFGKNLNEEYKNLMDARKEKCKEYIVLNNDGTVLIFAADGFGGYFNFTSDYKEYMINGEAFRLEVEGKWQSSNGKMILSLWSKHERKYIDFADGEIVQYTCNTSSFSERLEQFEAKYTFIDDSIEYWHRNAGGWRYIRTYEKVSGF